MSFSFVSLVFFVFFRCVKLSACVRASWSTWLSQRLWKPWRTWSLTLKTWDQVLLFNAFMYLLLPFEEFSIHSVWIWVDAVDMLAHVDSWQWLFAWIGFIVIIVEWLFYKDFLLLFKIIIFKWGYDYDHEKLLFVIYVLFNCFH